MITQTREENLKDTGAAQAKARRKGAEEAPTQGTGVTVPVRNGTGKRKPNATAQMSPESNRRIKKVAETNIGKGSTEREAEAGRGENRSRDGQMQICCYFSTPLVTSFLSEMVVFSKMSASYFKALYILDLFTNTRFQISSAH